MSSQKRHRQRIRDEHIRDLQIELSNIGCTLLAINIGDHRKPITFTCPRRHLVTRRMKNFRERCPSCTEADLALTLQDRAAIHGGIVLGIYRSLFTPTILQCHVGHIWTVEPISIIANGTWCPTCTEIVQQTSIMYPLRYSGVARERETKGDDPFRELPVDESSVVVILESEALLDKVHDLECPKPFL